MDPQKFTHKYHTLKNGYTYHYVDEKPANYNPVIHPTILCIHGFPDLWWGWRYQIQPFVSQGWRVIVPDQLGYGGTDKPKILEAYSFKNLANNLNELIEDGVGLGKDAKVVIACHDWGAMIGQRFWLYYPEKVTAIVSLCVPFTPPTSSTNEQYVPLETIVRTTIPSFGYQLFFASERSTELLDSLVATFITPSFSFINSSRSQNEGIGQGGGNWAKEGRLEASLRNQQAAGSEEKLLKSGIMEKDPELRYYYEQLKMGGFDGPLNYYRTREINWYDEKALSPTFPKSAPALLLSPTNDGALPLGLSLSPGMWKSFPGKNLWWKSLQPGTDHWILQNPRFRNGVNDVLIEFIKGALEGRWKAGDGEVDKGGRRLAKL